VKPEEPRQFWVCGRPAGVAFEPVTAPRGGRLR